MEGPKNKHDQSKIKNDGWTDDQLKKDQSGNDATIKKLEEELAKRGISTTDTVTTPNTNTTEEE